MPKKANSWKKQYKILGLDLDENICWKNHVQKMSPKLSSACYLVRRMYPRCKSNTLKIIYFTYFHVVMQYGIIFWGFSRKNKNLPTTKKNDQNYDSIYFKDFM
jgi:hypothetical protein